MRPPHQSFLEYGARRFLLLAVVRKWFLCSNCWFKSGDFPQEADQAEGVAGFVVKRARSHCQKFRNPLGPLGGTRLASFFLREWACKAGTWKVCECEVPSIFKFGCCSDKCKWDCVVPGKIPAVSRKPPPLGDIVLPVSHWIRAGKFPPKHC